VTKILLLQLTTLLPPQAVMSTDIVDKDLKELRNNRWEKAFKKPVSSTSSHSTNAAIDSDKESVDRKATIIIEHIIQASDISHTMQHWIIYRKWVRLVHRAYYGGYHCCL
jgi:hypothetical protein